MKEEVIESLSVIRQACASVTANLETHQQIQNAIETVEKELIQAAKENDAKTPSKARTTAD